MLNERHYLISRWSGSRQRSHLWPGCRTGHICQVCPFCEQMVQRVPGLSRLGRFSCPLRAVAPTSQSVASMVRTVSVSWSMRAFSNAKSLVTRVGRVCSSDKTFCMLRPCVVSWATCRSVSKTCWSVLRSRISSGSMCDWMPESSLALAGDPCGTGLGLWHEAVGKGGVGLGKGWSVGE